MTLDDVIKLLDDLSSAELNALRDQIDERLVVQSSARGLTPDERIRRLNAAASAIREGFSSEEWAQVVHAMTDEYIEPVDDTQWQD